MLLFPRRELSVSCEAAFCMHWREAIELHTLGTPCKVGKVVCITIDTPEIIFKDITSHFNIETLCIILMLFLSLHIYLIYNSKKACNYHCHKQTNKTREIKLDEQLEFITEWLNLNE